MGHGVMMGCGVVMGPWGYDGAVGGCSDGVMMGCGVMMGPWGDDGLWGDDGAVG